MKPKPSHIAKISPIAVGKTLRRDRLFALLKTESPTRAFWISGPGGAGKTTLIADFLQSAEAPSLWYQVDSLDSDPATFFYYFGRAAEPFLESQHNRPPLLTREYLPRIDVFILRYFETLFQQLTPGSWLVFDNFQDAPEDSPLPAILHSAVKQLPEQITIVVLSRSEPPPVMTRFIANRTMKHIGWNKLAFSFDEFFAFLQLTENGIERRDASRLHIVTRGWIAGAVLWLLNYSGEEIPETIPAEWTPENIFDYFASEILEKASPENRHFLLQTAFLPSTTVGMAKELTGMAATEILENLHRRNFFVEKHRLPEISYQYHPLFRRFLYMEACRFYDDPALQALRSNAARILERHGMIEEAFRLYRQVDAFPAMETIILSQAQDLVDQGRYTVLSGWIDALPKELSAAQPWLLLWKSIARVPFNPKESVRLATEAFFLFAGTGDIEGRVLSWSTVVDILTMVRSGFSKLDGWIELGERLGDRLSDEDQRKTGLSGRFAAAMLMALLLRNPGHPEMEKWQTRCEKLLSRCNDQQVAVVLIKNLFWSYYWLGQLQKAREIEEGLKSLRDSENISPFSQLILNALLALAALMRGDHQKCHGLVRESLDLAGKTGIHVFDFLIQSFSIYSWLGQGDLASVQPLLTSMFRSLSTYAVWDKGQFHFISAWFAMQGSELQSAEEHLNLAFKLEKACGNPLTIAFCKILRSQFLLEIGQPDKAEAVLGNILAEPRLRNNRILPFLVGLAQADCACTQQREDLAYSLCSASFSAASREGLWIPFGLCHRRMGPLCHRALARGLEKKTVEEMIRRWNLKPSPDGQEIVRRSLPLRISVLGGFAMVHRGKPLLFSAKIPKKPLELLSVLICAGSGGIHRETAADRLWPDADGDRAIRSLNTTVHRLRRLLIDEDSVTLRSGRLFLNQERCWVDCWRFQSLAQQILTQKSAAADEIVAEALALFKGEYALETSLSITVTYANQLRSQWLDLLAAALPSCATAGFANDTGRVVCLALAEDETAAAVFKKIIASSRKKGKALEIQQLLHQCRRLLADQGITLGELAGNVLDR